MVKIKYTIKTAVLCKITHISWHYRVSQMAIAKVQVQLGHIFGRSSNPNTTEDLKQTTCNKIKSC